MTVVMTRGEDPCGGLCEESFVGRVHALDEKEGEGEAENSRAKCKMVDG